MVESLLVNGVLCRGAFFMINTITSALLSASILLMPVNGGEALVAGQAGQMVENPIILSSAVMDLSYRYPVESVSEGFKENILVALGYIGNFTLQPGEVFAFHQKGILSEFREDKIVSQDSDFTTNTGYKVVAGLGGNGVCHLASLMNMAAINAGLVATAPTNHNFTAIPGIDKQYGVSISTRNSPERQNLYIRNNFEFPVRFGFTLNGDLLTLSIHVIR